METNTQVQAIAPDRGVATMGANQPLTIKSLFAKEDVRKRFEEMLGKKAQGFITSVLQIASSNELLKKADPMSIYNAAAVAATLDLPLNNNLGFAYIIPYNQKYQEEGQWKSKQVAQFQLGYKGFIQLALRSGQFRTIAECPIFEGQLIEQNPLTGFVFDFSKKASEKVIGYAAYFSLINGFEKTFYMTTEQVSAHGKKYSKTFTNGKWNDDFDAMARKTVVKLLLSKYAPLSIEMQKAQMVDQSVIKDDKGDEVEYVDHEVVQLEEINAADLQILYDMKSESLSEEEKIAAERIIKGNETRSFKKLQTLLQSK